MRDNADDYRRNQGSVSFPRPPSTYLQEAWRLTLFMTRLSKRVIVARAQRFVHLTDDELVPLITHNAEGGYRRLRCLANFFGKYS